MEDYNLETLRISLEELKYDVDDVSQRIFNIKNIIQNNYKSIITSPYVYSNFSEKEVHLDTLSEDLQCFINLITQKQREENKSGNDSKL